MTDAGRTVVIVQARMGSVRLPGKVMADVLGQPLLGHLLDRLARARRVDEVVVAIPDTPANDVLAEFCDQRGVRVVRGSESDVLDRYHSAAQAVHADVIVRITADCPMADPAVVDAVVDEVLNHGRPYAHTEASFPDGFDAEALTRDALEGAWRESTDAYDREHVTPFIRRAVGSAAGHVAPSAPAPDGRVTLDEPEDLQVITDVFEHFGHNEFGHEDVIELMASRPALFDANRQLGRNMGSEMGSGEKLWERAKRVIPGGSMLLSKRAEMHLPSGWPAYFSRASGCRVWDLDGREYVDVGLMGVGTNILGYGHPAVDEAVRKVIDTGNMSTLNGPEEVELAERLVELHPWADMVRFARSGGEACAIAVRIARAASGKSGVAFCGYHGWHDWYLAANLAEDTALDGHLLQGLQPNGVPRELIGSARPFAYNDLDALDAVMANGDVGVIFMEVERSYPPAEAFLQGARALADKHRAVLVFDECTSGFRKVVGGHHLTLGVDPDIAVFGKTLGNGYAVTAVVGREAVMDAAQTTFVSSTFWTERIGAAAALATLGAMEELDATRHVDAIGRSVRARWHELAAEADLQISTGGIPAIGTFTTTELDPLVAKTFVTAQLLRLGFIGGTAFYASLAHDEETLERYFAALAPIFGRMASATTSELVSELPGGSAQAGFQRLT